MLDNGLAVKICGITNVQDAVAAASAGADLIGVNFSDRSLRRISRETVAKIIAAIRPRFGATKIVGVFVDQDRQMVEQLVRELELDAVQLHGDESSEYVANLQAPFVIKAVRIRNGEALFTVKQYDCDAILLDSWSEHAAGGTGRTFSWPAVAALGPIAQPFILAGGLNSSNVAAAVRETRPAAVDVCSGVEDEPGRKNLAKMREFIKAARAAAAV